MTKLLRWYAFKNTKTGVFNKDAMINIRILVPKLVEKSKKLAEKAKNAYPSVDELRKLKATSKKEKKGEGGANEKKGSKSKDKKKDAKNEK